MKSQPAPLHGGVKPSATPTLGRSLLQATQRGEDSDDSEGEEDDDNRSRFGGAASEFGGDDLNEVRRRKLTPG